MLRTKAASIIIPVITETTIAATTPASRPLVVIPGPAFGGSGKPEKKIQDYLLFLIKKLNRGQTQGNLL